MAQSPNYPKIYKYSLLPNFMVSQVKINNTSKFGGLVALFSLGLILLFGASSFLFSVLCIGFIIAIIGALVGKDYFWKCDYCTKTFRNKGECVKHEKKCKLKK